MDEQQWLDRIFPAVDEMLIFLCHQCSDRKLRLFATACCRRMPAEYVDPRIWRLVEVAEHFAEGQTTQEELFAERNAATAVAAVQRQQCMDVSDWDAVLGALGNPCDPLRSAEGSENAICNDAYNTDEAHGVEPPDCRALDLQQKEAQIQADLLRDIFGNPFRPITIDPVWRTSSVVNIALASYEEQVFDRLPVLADALEDAGCDNRDILDHCRGPGPHARGCWVVDLLLGKE